MQTGQLSAEEIAMLLGQKDMEIFALQRLVMALQKQLQQESATKVAEA